MSPVVVPLSDDELLARFREGDSHAATAIYNRYAARLRVTIQRKCSRALAARIDPDDILQSAFGSFFRRAIEPATSGIHPQRLWGLLLLVSLHKIQDAADYHCAAKRDRRRERPSGSDDSRLSRAAITDDAVLQELTDLVNHLVGLFPHPDDQIVRMRIQGYEVREIADQTQRSKRTVERVLQDFRTTLESLIRET